jgi:hypothetical protein
MQKHSEIWPHWISMGFNEISSFFNVYISWWKERNYWIIQFYFGIKINLKGKKNKTDITTYLIFFNLYKQWEKRNREDEIGKTREKGLIQKIHQQSCLFTCTVYSLTYSDVILTQNTNIAQFITDLLQIYIWVEVRLCSTKSEV